MQQTISVRQISRLLDISIQSVMSYLERKQFTALRKDGTNVNSAWIVDRKSFCGFLRNRISACEAKAEKLAKILAEVEK